MDLTFRLIYAACCSGTHHKLAFDSLRYLKNERSERWRRLFLKHAEAFVEGSKAPDKVFKDFRNHVLHVGDNYWGGAPETACEWYDKFLAALHERRWRDAVYNAGVLSHYYTDPIQPLHTAQSQAENNIHRAFEWSISKSYETLRRLAEAEFGKTQVVVPDSFDWLKKMVQRGAEYAYPHYDMLVAQYDFDQGVQDPPSGLNEDSQRILAGLIIYASMGFARILDKGFAQSGIIPPAVNLTPQTVLAGLKIPVRWVVNKLADKNEKALVLQMYDEFQRTGTVEVNLPEDDRIVRDLHEKEVLAPKPPGSLAKALYTIHAKMQKADGVFAKNDEEKSPVTPENAKPEIKQRVSHKVYLQGEDDVEKAPSIGKKTAARLMKADIKTVSDLLCVDPQMISDKVGMRYITKAVVKDWQDQARLVCTIPGLRGRDAQLLTGCDYRDIDFIAAANPDELLVKVKDYCQTSKGQRIIRSGSVPDMPQIAKWVHNAKLAIMSKAA